jgi:hypothetical protein
VILLFSDLDIAVEANRVLRGGVVDESGGSVCGKGSRVEDTADVCEVFLVQSRVALTESPRIDHDLGSYKTQWISGRIVRGRRKAEHLGGRSKRVETKRRRITWLRSFFLHLGDCCRKMWCSGSRSAGVEDLKTTELVHYLGWRGQFEVELSFNFSQAPTHISKHRQ